MTTYIQNERIYREIIERLISHELSAHEFVIYFMWQWKIDRDNQYKEIDSGLSVSDLERQLCEALLDPIFTACDCYDPDPTESYELSATQLITEVENIQNDWLHK